MVSQGDMIKGEEEGKADSEGEGGRKRVHDIDA
jgi:hypothetical protein